MTYIRSKDYISTLKKVCEMKELSFLHTQIDDVFTIYNYVINEQGKVIRDNLPVSKDHSIKNTFLQDFMCENLKNILKKKKCKLNSIYNESIKEIIQISKDYTANIRDINAFNKLVKIDIGLGYFYIDLLTHYKVFTITENERKAKILIPVDKVIAEVSLNRSMNEPFISNEQFDAGSTSNFELIHDNHRIDLEIKEDCYMHKESLSTELSVDVDYLTIFLNMLYEGFDEDDHLDLFQINKDHIKILRSFSNPFITSSLDRIFYHVFDFNTVTNKILLEMLEATETQVHEGAKLIMEESLEKSFNIILKTYYQYKPLLESIINKISQRRYLYINLLNQAIQYSLYKYFIHPTFMDTRGRVYASGVALNIFTSPLAKSFIKLHDSTGGQHPSEKMLEIIKKCLKFNQTRNQFDSLIKFIKDDLYKDKHVSEIHNYICSYLTISINEFQELISPLNFTETYRFLLEK